MSEDTAVPFKRFRQNGRSESVLNLSKKKTALSDCNNEPLPGAEKTFGVPNLTSKQAYFSMEAEYRKWIHRTYKHTSKTKTITQEKYDRIVRTLRGQVKNCAENSKFRFWMKSKGFKLGETSNDDDCLYVLDKKLHLRNINEKGTTRYKKVAVVESFFDIIYKIHVNNTAEGIKHAGQKRTHRSITETYAFLPREAVTKFLSCCKECKKRTVSSNSESPLADSPCSTAESANIPTNCIQSISETSPEKTRFPDFQDVNLQTNIVNVVPSLENQKQYTYNEDEPQLTDASGFDIHRNQPLSRKTVEPNLTYYCHPTDKHTKPSSENNNTMMENRMEFAKIPFQQTHHEGNQDEKVRMRKRKFTTKIVRTIDESEKFVSKDVSPISVNSSDNSMVGPGDFQRTSTPIHQPESLHPADDTPVTTNKTEKSKEGFLRNLDSESSISFGSSDQNSKSYSDQYFKHFQCKSTYCPYTAKMSEILYNPVKYAEELTNKQMVCMTDEHFLEKITVDLVLKAKKIELIKEKLSATEKEEIPLKVLTYRIASFMINYAADSLLKAIMPEPTFEG